MASRVQIEGGVDVETALIEKIVDTGRGEFWPLIATLGGIVA